jgi:hypothetical protein
MKITWIVCPEAAFSGNSLVLGNDECLITHSLVQGRAKEKAARFLWRLFIVDLVYATAG